jgi:hypothetical protein
MRTSMRRSQPFVAPASLLIATRGHRKVERISKRARVKQAELFLPNT